jgi:hypothetical protein
MKWADDYARAYGADRYCGRWGLNIAIEDPYKYDGVSYYKCHSCEYTWDRFTGKKVELNHTNWGEPSMAKK